ncbi:MAG: hypothetical protein VB108_08145 [Anaerolineaceae bacterium]|nr:hypothetical protein [Anaerolineaceae bacterium]
MKKLFVFLTIAMFLAACSPKERVRFKENGKSTYFTDSAKIIKQNLLDASLKYSKLVLVMGLKG